MLAIAHCPDVIREAPDLERYTRQPNCSNLICHSGRAWRVSAAAPSDMTASQMRLHTAHSVIEPLTFTISQKPLSHWSTDTQTQWERRGIIQLMLCQSTKPDWSWQLKLEAVIRQLIKTLRVRQQRFSQSSGHTTWIYPGKGEKKSWENSR